MFQHNRIRTFENNLHEDEAMDKFFLVLVWHRLDFIEEKSKKLMEYINIEIEIHEF